MTSKEWLKRGNNIEKEILALCKQRDKAYSLACNTVKEISPDKVQASKQNDQEGKLITYADYTRMIDQRIIELANVRAEILAAINRVPDATYRTLLIERYINGQTWEKIAEQLKLSERWVRGELHQRALAAIEPYAKKAPHTN